MKKTYFIISAMLIYIMLSILPAHAENINIIGEVKDNLKLSIDNEYIFDRNNIMPGEEWSTDITLENNSKEDMKVSLLKISADNVHVGNCLYLSIYTGNSVLYEGNYLGVNNPYFTIDVNAMERKLITADIKVIPTADNSLQNESLHSIWEFEAQTTADIKPTAAPMVKSNAVADNSNGSSSHSTGIIARLFSKNKSSEKKIEGVVSAESDTSEPFPGGRNFGAEISEENIDTENTSDNAGSEPLSSDIDTEKNKNKGQNNETKTANSARKNKPVKTGNEHIPNNTTEITNIMMISLPFIVITFILIRRRKSKRR